MNTGTTKYENGKLNGSILIQFNPGVTVVTSTTLRVSFEYNDEENSINDTIEGNITFNYLNRSIDLQNMTFNPSTVEYNPPNTAYIQFTINYTSQNYTPDKLNVKFMNGHLIDTTSTGQNWLVTMSRFSLTTSDIVIDESTIKGTLEINFIEEMYDTTTYNTYSIEIVYEDSNDRDISDSVTQTFKITTNIAQNVGIMFPMETLLTQYDRLQKATFEKNPEFDFDLEVGKDIFYTTGTNITTICPTHDLTSFMNNRFKDITITNYYRTLILTFTDTVGNLSETIPNIFSDNKEYVKNNFIWLFNRIYVQLILTNSKINNSSQIEVGVPLDITTFITTPDLYTVDYKAETGIGDYIRFYLYNSGYRPDSNIFIGSDLSNSITIPQDSTNKLSLKLGIQMIGSEADDYPISCNRLVRDAIVNGDLKVSISYRCAITGYGEKNE